MSPIALVTADLDQHRWLEVEPALVSVLDTIAVLLWRESGCRPLTGIDTQPRTLDILVIHDRLPVAGCDVVAARVIRNFNDFLEKLVRLLLARTPVLVAKVVVLIQPPINLRLDGRLSPIFYRARIGTTAPVPFALAQKAAQLSINRRRFSNRSPWR